MSVLLDKVNRPGTLLADAAAAPAELVYLAPRQAAPVTCTPAGTVICPGWEKSDKPAVETDGGFWGPNDDVTSEGEDHVSGEEEDPDSEPDPLMA